MPSIHKVYLVLLKILIERGKIPNFLDVFITLSMCFHYFF
jgi:hypothetical protein